MVRVVQEQAVVRGCVCGEVWSGGQGPNQHRLALALAVCLVSLVAFPSLYKSNAENLEPWKAELLWKGTAVSLPQC